MPADVSVDQVPAALAGSVAAVAGDDEGPAWRRHAPPPPQGGDGLMPAELREAYAVVSEADGEGVTVGSLQFSGWDASDLSDWAAAVGQPAPQVDALTFGAVDPAVDDGAAGSFEVAMDQQALAVGAPRARQRVYFVQNGNAAALAAALGRMADDAESGLVDVVSTSWGLCEQEVDASYDLDVLRGLWAAVVANGATVFAASGDTSALDCAAVPGSPFAGEDAVDFPASAPEVLGVGGTRLERGWTRTAWGSPDGSFGSGGGQSAFFGRPAAQGGVPSSSSPRSIGCEVAGGCRLVPDLALVGDETTGLLVWWSGLIGARGGGDDEAAGWYTGGGTSLSAPLAAGMLAGTLSAAGRTDGAGPLTRGLYEADADDAFVDVVDGGNGHVNARPGHDLVTGLGAPRWCRLSDDLLPDGKPREERGLTADGGDLLLVEQDSCRDVALRTSGDGGATWSTPQRLGGDPLGGPAVTALADGTVVHRGPLVRRQPLPPRAPAGRHVGRLGGPPRHADRAAVGRHRRVLGAAGRARCRRRAVRAAPRPVGHLGQLREAGRVPRGGLAPVGPRRSVPAASRSPWRAAGRRCTRGPGRPPGSTRGSGRAGTAKGSPAVTGLGGGDLDLFVRGADDVLYLRRLRSGTWLPWTGLGGQLVTSPAAAAGLAADRSDVVVVQTDGLAYQKTRTGETFSGFRPVG